MESRRASTRTLPVTWAARHPARARGLRSLSWSRIGPIRAPTSATGWPSREAGPSTGSPARPRRAPSARAPTTRRRSRPSGGGGRPWGPSPPTSPPRRRSSSTSTRTSAPRPSTRGGSPRWPSTRTAASAITAAACGSPRPAVGSGERTTPWLITSSGSSRPANRPRTRSARCSSTRTTRAATRSTPGPVSPTARATPRPASGCSGRGTAGRRFTC
jgi:hypothetical protein